METFIHTSNVVLNIFLTFVILEIIVHCANMHLTKNMCMLCNLIISNNNIELSIDTLFQSVVQIFICHKYLSNI